MARANVNWTVLTGSTGGIGREIAKILAERGQNLILLNRSESKTQVQRNELLKEHSGLLVEQVIADLMDTDQVASAISEINAISGRVNTIYNNSGVLTAEKVLSKQGYESQFAVNTLAPYLLTLGLRDKMARAASEEPGMVVLFSSGAVTAPKALNLRELANPDTVGGLMQTYAQTKLAATALAPALAGLLEEHNICIRAVDPGATKTAMTTTGNAAMPLLLRWLSPFLFASAEKQAIKIVDSAAPSAFGGRTGIFVANRKMKPLPSTIVHTAVQDGLKALLETCH